MKVYFVFFEFLTDHYRLRPLHLIEGSTRETIIDIFAAFRRARHNYGWQPFSQLLIVMVLFDGPPNFSIFLLSFY